jgi:transaldolase
MMMAALGADHITIGRPLLDDLAEHNQLPAYQKGNWKVRVGDQVGKPGFAWEDWNPPLPNELKENIAKVVKNTEAAKIDNLDIDYLADGVVDKLNDEDDFTRAKLAEGLKRFTVWEKESRKEIERLQAVYA